MPRFFGGGGTSSSSFSGSNRVKIAATLLGLSSLTKNLERFPSADKCSANKCQIILHLYEECMSRNPTRYCDNYRETKASCGEIKRAPGLRRMAERHEEWKASQQREATAAGFANMFEYWKHQSETDPRMCRITYELYKECLASHLDETKRYCENYRNNCPQFK